MDFLTQGILAITWKQVVMFVIGGLLIWLALKKQMEPALLLPMGFGAILVNIPFSGVLNQTMEGAGEVQGIIDWLFEVGIHASEAMPLLLFIGIGAMIDFGPVLSNPKLLLFGAAAQFGVFLTITVAALLGFDLIDAASIGIIGAADGPTSILVSLVLGSRYIGAIAVAAYSYMALVPIIQPFAIKLCTTKKERRIRMTYEPKSVSKTTRILFPIGVTVVAGLVAPSSVALVGFLMFGNLIRECGVLENLSQTAQKELANLITLLLGLTISASMKAENFVNWQTVMIMVLGVLAFVFDTMAGCMFAKLINLFFQKEDQPHGGCSRYLRVPHVLPRDPEDGPAGRPPEPPADARRWRQCSGSDRFGHRGRRDPGPGARHAAVRKEVLLWICMW